ncbi:MAG: tetratricopeptide repeat protein, partial [Verrucomicrobiota bacterium]|nr:tetratricopeptide repeat protein [Verrucomicrobiota bacterium]
VLMGFFFLLTLICWARFLEKNTRNRAAFYVGALACYALALFSKTTACTLPAALVLILWLRRMPITLRRWLEIAPFVALAAAMAAVTIWWERYHQGTQGAAFAVGFGERVLIANRALWFYLAKLIWPNELSFSYPHWSISTAHPLDYLWPVLTIAVAFAIWFLRRYTGRSVEVAMTFFVATLLPVLGFVMLWTFRYSWVADHYQYLACIGPLTLFGAGIDRAASRFGPSRNLTLGAIAAVLLLSLGVRTWKQGAIYADAETLWRATIETNPRSALAHNSLGVILGTRNAPIEDELSEYRAAVESEPNDAEAHNNQGYALQRLGRTDEALREYEKSVAADPRYAVAQGNLATLLLQQGRSDEAVSHLEKVLAIDPQNAALEHSLGDILAAQGRANDSLAHWKRALELDPRDAALQAKVGRTLAAAGQFDAALPYLRAASELAPEDAQAHFNYAAALSLLSRFAEAIPENREAVRLQPNLAEAHLNLAIAYLQTGQINEGVAEYERTAELKPNDAAIHTNLAAILRHLGRNAEADTHAERAAELARQGF